MRSAEGQRARHAVPQQLVQEKHREFVAMRLIGTARLVREGVVLQPGQEPVEFSWLEGAKRKKRVKTALNANV